MRLIAIIDTRVLHERQSQQPDLCTRIMNDNVEQTVCTNASEATVRSPAMARVFSKYFTSAMCLTSPPTAKCCWACSRQFGSVVTHCQHVSQYDFFLPFFFFFFLMPEPESDESSCARTCKSVSLIERLGRHVWAMGAMAMARGHTLI